jgi:hypothetical protein
MALAAAALAAVVPGPAAAATSFGIHTQRLNDFEAARMARGGATYVRSLFEWRIAQPQEDGPYRWGRFDSLVLHSALHGMQVLPVVIGSPDYVARRPSLQPRSREDLRRFQAYLTALAHRYGPDGTFWRSLPIVPYTPVTHWQIWNEPNLHNYWKGALKPASYAKFVSIARDALRSADPSAQVVLAGMPETKSGLPMSNYLKGLYGVKGFRKSVDAIAAHSYATNAKGVLRTMRIERRVMDKAGDTSTPLWVTEIGWATDGPKDHPLVRNTADQARLLTRSFGLLKQNSRSLRLGPVFWFNWRDAREPTGNEADHFSKHTGLFTRDRVPKPSWPAFAEAAGGVPGSGPIPPGTSDLGLGGLGDLP